MSRVKFRHFLSSNPPVCLKLGDGKGRGGGASSQFGQCQDFGSAFYPNPSLSLVCGAERGSPFNLVGTWVSATPPHQPSTLLPGGQEGGREEEKNTQLFKTMMVQNPISVRFCHLPCRSGWIVLQADFWFMLTMHDYAWGSHWRIWTIFNDGFVTNPKLLQFAIFWEPSETFIQFVFHFKTPHNG